MPEETIIQLISKYNLLRQMAIVDCEVDYFDNCCQKERTWSSDLIWAPRQPSTMEELVYIAELTIGSLANETYEFGYKEFKD